MLAHAPKSESLFSQIQSRSSEMGMRVNEQKTQVLCISAASTGTVESYINTANSRITSTNQLKILGFWFDQRPGVELHIEKLEKKFRSRLWTLRHLKRSGMTERDLLYLYKTVVRPVADFASVTYHTMLNSGQIERLESLQRRALKIIHGVNKTSSELLSVSNVPSLAERREKMFCEFAKKASTNPKITEKWFPLTDTDNYHNTRHFKKYKEFRARTNRLLNSPLYQLRKRLNDLE